MTILQKVVPERDTRIWFAGLIIIAANAGGAWSPIGDVTTTMLWIGKKVTTIKLITYLLIPSIVCLLVPTVVATFLPAFKGNIIYNPNETKETMNKNGSIILYLGLASIIFVPVFATCTHLPP